MVSPMLPSILTRDFNTSKFTEGAKICDFSKKSQIWVRIHQF
jgi:hypothetical protein